MEIVIDLLEETYNEVRWRGLALCPRDEENLVKAIKNGTPLPKGHGRLKDVDKILDEIRKREEEPNYQHEGEDWCVGLCMAESVIESAQTIISKQKGEK